ncbi:transcription factor grauzone-like isoform X1 [Ochlerotatus camptorhynchus]|uniref:transcription factor grauzone-like isoform X1 n=2 Tax=Ochlerotatus camptorhynchus TaxID=644619 RepID=UPI0031D03BCE
MLLMATGVCITCIKSIGSDEPSLTISASQDVQNALSKHFWFGEDQCLRSFICQQCWHKIDEFNRFYCEVEQLHAQQTYPPIHLLEIKQEVSLHQFIPELEEPDQLDTGEIKGEAVNEKIPDDQSDENDDDGEGDSAKNISSDDDDHDSDFKTKHQKLEKVDVDQIQQFITANIKLECTVCSEKSGTFEDLQRHSMMQHETRARVFCCEQKFINGYRLNGHVQFHLNPDSFKCSHCSKQCPNKEALRRHKQKVHTPEEEKKYHCKVCPRKFTARNALSLHVKNHAETDPNDDGQPRKSHRANRTKRVMDNEKMIAENVSLECDSCQKKFDTFVILQKHSMAEHKKLSYVLCCGKKFNMKPRLVDHVRFHLDPTTFQCKVCFKNLPHTESLKRHMDRNHTSAEAKTLKCSMCPKMFSHKQLLNTHERYHNRSWHCEICDRRFICEAVLKQHHRSVHTKELNYVCHICAKTFHVYSSYRSHLQSHDERVKPQRRPVQCPVCGAMTPELSHHMRLHSGTKTCELCAKVCKNVMAYQYHMRQHETGDFVCSVCGKGFKRDITLKEHMASHTGEVLYSCDFCERTFNSNANRAAHRKKMHPQQWLEDKLKKKAARQQAPVGVTGQAE